MTDDVKPYSPEVGDVVTCIHGPFERLGDGPLLPATSIVIAVNVDHSLLKGAVVRRMMGDDWDSPVWLSRPSTLSFYRKSTKEEKQRWGLLPKDPPKPGVVEILADVLAQACVNVDGNRLSHDFISAYEEAFEFFGFGPYRVDISMDELTKAVERKKRELGEAARDA